MAAVASARADVSRSDVMIFPPHRILSLTIRVARKFSQCNATQCNASIARPHVRYVRLWRMRHASPALRDAGDGDAAVARVASGGRVPFGAAPSQRLALRGNA
jgi:hypothetical protein